MGEKVVAAGRKPGLLRSQTCGNKVTQLGSFVGQELSSKALLPELSKFHNHLSSKYLHTHALLALWDLTFGRLRFVVST